MSPTLLATLLEFKRGMALVDVETGTVSHRNWWGGDLVGLFKDVLGADRYIKRQEAERDAFYDGFVAGIDY